MYRGFNLKIGNEYDRYHKFGEEIYEQNCALIQESLDEFALDDIYLDGSKMQADWFPQVHADVFVSHSHIDEYKAVSLAGWISKEFNLEVFIDSCIWGCAGNLLRIIDDVYCLNYNRKTYNYSKRNCSTSHVHMMLSTALTMMIDNTECLFFLNTPNSITPEDVIKNTKSPWIYSEIAMTRLIRRKDKNVHRERAKMESLRKAANEELLIKYNLELDHLHDIDGRILKKWFRLYDGRGHALDVLYDLLLTPATRFKKLLEKYEGGS